MVYFDILEFTWKDLRNTIENFLSVLRASLSIRLAIPTQKEHLWAVILK